MKKFIITACEAIVIGLLMVSSATAVPKLNSDPLMNKINEIEKTKKIIEENIKNKTPDLKIQGLISLLIKKMKDTIYDITLNLTPGGLIDLLIKIIEWMISIVQNLINLVYKIFDLVDIIYTLVNLIGTLIELIIELINSIIDIFTPGTIKFI
ncbi:Uncharacterised protein [uncultured archaeon]|nr:Uncharacterised protein [uncultured archaeon]